MEISFGSFVWDDQKEAENILRHGIDFSAAAKAFLDPKRAVYVDAKHSVSEERWFCLGKVDNKVITVRFVYRDQKIRIIGAGYWRKGRRYYRENETHG